LLIFFVIFFPGTAENQTLQHGSTGTGAMTSMPIHGESSLNGERLKFRIISPVTQKDPKTSKKTIKAPEALELNRIHFLLILPS
jgi:hypothetical protein